MVLTLSWGTSSQRSTKASAVLFFPDTTFLQSWGEGLAYFPLSCQRHQAYAQSTGSASQLLLISIYPGGPVPPFSACHCGQVSSPLEDFLPTQCCTSNRGQVSSLLEDFVPMHVIVGKFLLSWKTLSRCMSLWASFFSIGIWKTSSQPNAALLIVGKFLLQWKTSSHLPMQHVIVTTRLLLPESECSGFSG